MGKMTISMAEHRLREHLTLGGRPDDQIGRDLIWKFVTKVWTDRSVAPPLRQHGVTIQELATMYQAVIESLMPRPWMNVAGPMLVPTQWFMEPHRIENLLVETTRDTAGGDREEWLRRFIDNAQTLARFTRAAHDEQYGQPKVLVVPAGGLRSSKGGGCAGGLLLFTAAVASATFAILR
ncbi:MAG TPA: hypothetical protein VN461_12345 [Vicinamibacteria bacterium]|jgi:hypothetical protein|nr:hypothetical protein [Vicinamibacteria bacterium]